MVRLTLTRDRHDGHTVGHAIEAASQYKAMLHGEAVAWGMIAALRIAANRKLISESDTERMIVASAGSVMLHDWTMEEKVFIAPEAGVGMGKLSCAPCQAWGAS